jgi:hypothetical protein
MSSEFEQMPVEVLIDFSDVQMGIVVDYETFRDVLKEISMGSKKWWIVMRVLLVRRRPDDGGYS